MAKDASGLLLSDVPISATLVRYPGPAVGKPGGYLSQVNGTTSGSPPVFKTTLGLSSERGVHLLVFSVGAEGFEKVTVTITVTGNPTSAGAFVTHLSPEAAKRAVGKLSEVYWHKEGTRVSGEGGVR
jgi:hypothetical protein